jgi:hypothetical protein
MEQLLAYTCAFKIFSQIDLKSAYSQVGMKRGSKFITAFRTPLGNYKYRVIHFGLTNALSGFQPMINLVILPILVKEGSVYLNDILVKTYTYESNKTVLREVLKLLIQNNQHG